MRFFCSLLVALALLGVSAQAFAQQEPATTPKGSKDVIVTVRVIDKVAGQPITLSVAVGSVTNYQTLSILPRRCSVNDEGQFAALLEIYDQPPIGGTQELFSGWMFSASPSLTYIEHPFYDVTLAKCEPRKEEKNTGEEKNTPPAAP